MGEAPAKPTPRRTGTEKTGSGSSSSTIGNVAAKSTAEGLRKKPGGSGAKKQAGGGKGITGGGSAGTVAITGDASLPMPEECNILNNTE